MPRNLEQPREGIETLLEQSQNSATGLPPFPSPRRKPYAEITCKDIPPGGSARDVAIEYAHEDKPEG